MKFVASGRSAGKRLPFAGQEIDEIVATFFDCHLKGSGKNMETNAILTYSTAKGQ